jgi:hypothetical protein
MRAGETGNRSKPTCSGALRAIGPARGTHVAREWVRTTGGAIDAAAMSIAPEGSSR